MARYPIEIRRCRHIRTNGTQCGSPAVKEKEFCYYHEQNRTMPVSLYLDGDRYPDSQIMIPPFEDAHSIQKVLRHVVQLLFERRIEQRDAGLALYALQIASSNLKTMQAEKATPTEMVVEPEKVAETPLGMTQWSASGEGRDPENQDPGEVAAQVVLEANERWAERYRGELQWMMKEEKRISDYFDGKGNQDDRPLDMLDSVRTNLERGVAMIEKRLAESEMEVEEDREEVLESVG